MSDTAKVIEALTNREYQYGFVTEIEADSAPPGLDEDIIRFISAKKNEPPFMLAWRLRAYRHWATLERAAAEPRWANVTYDPIDYQKIVYYSAPKKTVGS
ncbi:MAG: Fe-S cluster assembly protein SufB, partial [bacterium]